jgi:hypothetical protein
LLHFKNSPRPPSSFTGKKSKIERINSYLKDVSDQLCSVVNVKDICNIIVSYLPESQIVNVETFPNHSSFSNSCNENLKKIHKRIEQVIGPRTNIKLLETDKFRVKFLQSINDGSVFFDSIFFFSDEKKINGWEICIGTLNYNEREMRSIYYVGDVSRCVIYYKMKNDEFSIQTILLFDQKYTKTFRYTNSSTYPEYPLIQKYAVDIDECTLMNSDNVDVLPRLLEDFPRPPAVKKLIDEMLHFF